MNQDSFNLLEKAKSAPEEPARNKLGPYLDVIAELRRKRWTYAKITAWLNEQGIRVSLASVHRVHVSARNRRRSIEHAASVNQPDLSEKPAKLGKPRWNQI